MILEVRVVDETLPVKVVFSKLSETTLTLFGGCRTPADIEVESSIAKRCRQDGKLRSSAPTLRLMQQADLVEVVYASGRRVYIKDRTGLMQDPKADEAFKAIGW